MSTDSTIETHLYIMKKGGDHGQAVEHFLKPTYFSREVLDLDTDRKLFRRTFVRDSTCHEDYLKHLIPRAAGYSAGLLNYFFRGMIEVSLPDEGRYALYDPQDPNRQFNLVTLMARNVDLWEEAMNSGSVELVVKYKLALDDPFQSYPVATSQQFHYIVVPEKNGVRSIPREEPVRLEFELKDERIPLYATDVYLYVVYRGDLGYEKNAVAVGFKDVSEPTIVDFYNDMDKICLYNQWYTAGSAEAIAVVDTDQNGIADTDEWDVYPHDLAYLYIKFSPLDNPQYPSETDYDYYKERIAAGSYGRIYVISDSSFVFGTSRALAPPISPADEWGVGSFSPMLFGTNAIKNQTDLADPQFCYEHNVEPPCYIRHYPTTTAFRGIRMWTGFTFENASLPYDAECPMEQLQ